MIAKAIIRAHSPPQRTMKLSPYIAIARPDHWFKNIFMLPGIMLVLFFYPDTDWCSAMPQILGGIFATCLICSANYILNELLDARRDAAHPTKKHRPVPSGDIRYLPAILLLILCLCIGLTSGFFISAHMGWSLFALWVMGLLYNIPPIRLKDKPYLDVLSESINNPIRLLLGWYSTGHLLMPPLSALMAYWMFGAFLMATKRFAEYRAIGCEKTAATYRSSFGHYTEQRLLESLYFYSAAFALLSGVFIARYQLELVLAIPAVAYTMAYYLHLGFKENSSAQTPERLYKEKKLCALLVLSFTLCTLLLMLDIPWFREFFDPWIEVPTS